MEDAEDRGGSDQFRSDAVERADAGRIRRWKRHQFRVAFGPQQRGSRPVQRLDRAASGRACPAGGGGPPPVYSKPADKLRDIEFRSDAGEEQALGGSDAGRDISSELHSDHSSAVQDRCRGSTAPHRGGPAPPAAAARPQSTQAGRQAERRWRVTPADGPANTLPGHRGGT